MSLRRRLQDEDVAQELILDSDSDAQISPPQRNSDTEQGYRAETQTAQWIDSAQSNLLQL
jgi:hypothetical protein